MQIPARNTSVGVLIRLQAPSIYFPQCHCPTVWVFAVMRFVVLGVVSFFALLVLILGAVVANFATSILKVYAAFASYPAFAIAISVLTLLTVPVMIYLSISRKGAFPSMIIVELSYLTLLWILWLSVGGTIGALGLAGYCALDLIWSDFDSSCAETQAMAGFSILNWLLLMMYNIFLLTLAIIQARRGNSDVWTTGVTEVDFLAKPQVAYTDTTTPTKAPATQYPQSVPTPQQMYPPQQLYSPQQMYSPQQGYAPQQEYAPQQQQPITNPV